MPPSAEPADPTEPAADERTPVDPYWRRRAAAAASREETRRRLLTAADELFREQGYVATTVSAIAQRAGVALQTLYLAWGSKRALLRAATDAAANAVADASAAAATDGARLPMEPDQWRSSLRAELAQAVGGDPSAGAYLAAFSRLFVRVAERTAPYWRMHRQSAATDPELAADWSALVLGRRSTMTVVVEGMPRQGLRPGLGETDVVDTLWTLASPEVYDLLTVDSGHSPAAFQAWLERTLVATLTTDRVAAEQGK